MVNRPPSPSPAARFGGNNSDKNKENASAASSVQVVVRLRPLNDAEKKHTLPVVSASTADRTVTLIKEHASLGTSRLTYKFDQVFTAFSTQRDVFEATLQPVICDVLQGFESTVFAYGQTGTGKTHTMEGNLQVDDEWGVIPRSATAIFDELNNVNDKSPYETLESTVTVSFLEIYNEELCDLLVDNSNTTPNASAGTTNPPSRATSSTNNSHQKLQIMEGKQGPFCRGLSEQTVESADQVLTLMRQAALQRQVGETNMNKQSSRSHCIFTIKVQATRKVRADGNVLQVTGKLHCVDLAGSECAKSANLGGGSKADPEQAARERERLNINRSLLTLGRVVSMLKENANGKKKNVRIPYRDSKLTRILQESLGGRCKTCLIATLSPSVTAIEESMSTLNYAQAANGIVNKPVNSSLLKQSNSGVSLSSSASCDKSNDATFGTIEHWREMEIRLEYMQSQVEEAQQALARMHLKQQALLDRTAAAEQAAELAESRVVALETAKTELTERYDAQMTETKRVSQQLAETETELQQTTTKLEAQLEENKVLGTKLASTEQALVETKATLAAQVEESKQVSAKLVAAEGNLAETKAALHAKEKENERLSSNLVITEKTLAETTAVLHATQTTEQTLTHEARELLSVLKDAENESRNLHQQLVKHYQEDVQRKNATKDFAKAVFLQLEAIGASTAKLRSSQQDFHTDLREKSGKFDRSQLELTKENQKSLEDLSNHVTASIGALKKHLSEQLVANATSTSKIVLEDASFLRQQASNGIEVLVTSCAELETMLDGAAENLHQVLREDYRQSSGQLLDTLTNEVSDSKQALTDLVDSLSAILDAARNSRAKNARSLERIAQNWKEFLSENTENIQNLTNARTQEITRVLEIMTGEQKTCHQAVDKKLKHQRSFLDASRESQSKQLQEHNQLLTLQKTALQSSHDKQQELCGVIVSNVMAGVKELLNAQMSALTQRQNEDFTSLASNNDQLVVSNQSVVSSITSIFDTVEDVNTALQSQATRISQNDAKAVSAFEETQSVTLQSIQSLCELQMAESNKFATSATTQLETNEGKDTESTQQLCQDLSKGSKTLATQLTDKLLKGATERVNNLSLCVSNATDLVQTDLVDTSKKTLGVGIEQPIRAVFSEITNQLQSVSVKVETGIDQLESDANDHIGNADKLDRDIISPKTHELSRKLMSQHQQVSVFNQHLDDLSKANESTSDTVARETKGKSESFGRSIEEYTSSVIAMEVETETVPPPKEFEYSKKLSATAPSETIIAKLWACKEAPEQDI